MIATTQATIVYIVLTEKVFLHPSIRCISSDSLIPDNVLVQLGVNMRDTEVKSRRPPHTETSQKPLRYRYVISAMREPAAVNVLATANHST